MPRRRRKCVRLKLALSRKWGDNVGTTDGRRLNATRCNERIFVAPITLILKGLFRFQRNDLRRTEIPCNVNPPQRTFGPRSEAQKAQGRVSAMSAEIAMGAATRARRAS